MCDSMAHWQQLESQALPLHTQPDAHLLQPDGQQVQQPVGDREQEILSKTQNLGSEKVNLVTGLVLHPPNSEAMDPLQMV